MRLLMLIRGRTRTLLQLRTMLWLRTLCLRLWCRCLRLRQLRSREHVAVSLQLWPLFFLAWVSSRLVSNGVDETRDLVATSSPTSFGHSDNEPP